MKRIIALLTAAIVLLTSIPVSAETLTGVSAVQETVLEQEESAAEETAREEGSEDPAQPVSYTSITMIQQETAMPEFRHSASVNGVSILVTAPEGVFPAGAELFVAEAAHSDAEGKVEELRGEDRTVAQSYTFDIKVLDQSGNEIQPTDSGLVKVSFTLPEVSSPNLDAQVYHIHDDGAAALDTSVEGDAVVVETDGFSLYTVEFTYNNKQYVLEGDTYVRVSEILSAVGLTGNISAYAVSDPELFNIYRGNADGVAFVEAYDDSGNIIEYAPINNEHGDTLYMIALQPFTTEEWLQLTIDGIEYTIVVTDAIRVDENGREYTNVKAMTASNSTTTTGGTYTITDSRVIQGPNESNFTATMPLAEIYIDDTIVNQQMWFNKDLDEVSVFAELLVDDTQDDGKYKGFTLNTTTGSSESDLKRMPDSYGALYYDFTKRGLNGTATNSHPTLTVTGSAANNYEMFSGPIVKYTLKGMATKFDVASGQYKDYDVILTYSDILISLCQTSGTGGVNQSTINQKLSLLDTNAVNIRWYNDGGSFRAGMSYSVNVQVVDPDTGNLVDGSYYYPMVDIDIGRMGVGGFANLYQASTFNRYSEQVALLSNYGRPTSTGSWEQKIWIPGGDWSAASTTNMKNITEDNFPYTCKISSVTVNDQQNVLLVQPGGQSGSVTSNIAKARGLTGGDNEAGSRNNSFYSGFITLANNTAGGIKTRGWVSAPASGGMESYVLTGSKIVNHRVDASSDVGGTIFTTTTGNSDGSLSGGSLLGRDAVNEPFELSAATGQSVTYTMTPKGGYKLKGVYVKDGDIDIMTIVNTAKATVDPASYDTDNDGELNESERLAYEADVQTAVNGALANSNVTNEVPISSLTALGKGAYAYTFRDIQEDKSIHIEWEKTDLTVTKQLSPSMPGVTDKFKFQIRLWDTTTQETTWRVRAKKNTGMFKYINTLENGQPFYISYWRSKTETVPYKYVVVQDTSDKNPFEEGWYVFYNGAYLPSYDTTVNESTTYYEIDNTQTSTVTEYLAHILGWNETTETWDNKTINGVASSTYDINLGPENLNDELSDAYRFETDGTYVYNKASYNSATEDYDEYLMWVHDDTINKEVLKIGNAETYPQGRPYTISESSSSFVYVYDEGIPDYSGKVIQTDSMLIIDNGSGSIYDTPSYYTNSSNQKHEFVEDTTTPIYYNLVNNHNGYTLDQGYSAVQGESGLYIVTLQNGQPNVSDLIADGWDVTVNRVGAIQDDFDLERAMAAAGAKSVSGAVNTYSFELGVDETIDFNGVVPMGYNYEITEILPTNSKWKELNKTANATVSDFDGEEHVTFTNTEKKYDITIEKETVDNKAGTFGFTIQIYKEEIIPAQNQTITVQAYKNSGETVANYVLTNSGAPIALEMNGKIVTIPTGDSNSSAGGDIAAVIYDLIAMDSSQTNPMTMNGLGGDVSAGESTSIYDQVQEKLNNGVTSFSLEPVVFSFSTPQYTNRIGYSPASVPAGFSGSNGVFTFDLTNASSKTFTGIPVGYKYKITETSLPRRWKNVSKINDEGTLHNDVTSTWVNEEKTMFDLTVKKETRGNESGSFEFKVKAWADTMVTYDDMYRVGEYFYNNGVIEDYHLPAGYEDYIDTSYVDTSEDGYFVKLKDGYFAFRGYTYDVAQNAAQVPFTGDAYIVANDYSSSIPALTQSQLDDLKTFLASWVNKPSSNVAYETNATFSVNNEQRTVYIAPISSGDGNIYIRDDGTQNFSDGPETWDVPNIKAPIDLSSQFGAPDANGYYTFTLSNGESMVIPDLPYGCGYEVIETPKSGWELISKTNDSGTILDDTTSTFVNGSITDITVHKKWVDGNAAHTTDEVKSILALFQNNTNVSTTYASKISVTDNGNSIFQYTASGLPKCDQNGQLYAYTVKEITVPMGYEVSYENGEAAVDGETITNTKYVDLVIRKTVSGNMGDKYKKFTFYISQGDQGVTSGHKSFYPFEPELYCLAKLNGKVYKVAGDNSSLIKEVTGYDAYIDRFPTIDEIFSNPVDYGPRGDRFQEIMGDIPLEVASYAPIYGAKYNGEDLSDAFMVELNNGALYYHQATGETYAASDISNVSEDTDMGSVSFDFARDTRTVIELSHSETYSITVPYGTTISVEEADYSGVGYTTTINGTERRNISVTMRDDETLDFVNRKDVAVPTRVTPFALLIPITGTILGIAAIMYILVITTKRREEEGR